MSPPSAIRLGSGRTLDRPGTESAMADGWWRQLGRGLSGPPPTVARRGPGPAGLVPVVPRWAVVGLSLSLLTVLALSDAIISPRFLLIGFFGLVPLMAAVVLSPAQTALIGSGALVAGLAEAQWADGGLDSYTGLRLGVVVACGCAAAFLAALRQRRERSLHEVSVVADVAQRAILGDGRYDLPDVDVVTGLRSALREAHVGGDFYAALHGPYGTRMIVGDVRGKGLPAVRLASAVVGGFRHAALNSPSIEEVACQLDVTVQTLAEEDEDFVTAVMVEVRSDHLCLICCGHHPPLIGRPGNFRSAELHHGTPLGLGGPRKLTTEPWAPDELYIAFTDGLVEARDSHGRMLDAVDWRGAVRSLDPGRVVDSLLGLVHEWAADDLRDDVAILVARRAGCRPTSAPSTPCG